MVNIIALHKTWRGSLSLPCVMFNSFLLYDILNGMCRNLSEAEIISLNLFSTGVKENLVQEQIVNSNEIKFQK